MSKVIGLMCVFRTLQPESPVHNLLHVHIVSYFCVTVIEIPDKTHLKDLFSRWFQRFQSVVSWPYVSGPVVRQNTMR
jgi:hypothetical protein